MSGQLNFPIHAALIYVKGATSVKYAAYDLNTILDKQARRADDVAASVSVTDDVANPFKCRPEIDLGCACGPFASLHSGLICER
jgi:hypothetical protein